MKCYATGSIGEVQSLSAVAKRSVEVGHAASDGCPCVLASWHLSSEVYNQTQTCHIWDDDKRTMHVFTYVTRQRCIE